MVENGGYVLVELIKTLSTNQFIEKILTPFATILHQGAHSEEKIQASPVKSFQRLFHDIPYPYVLPPTVSQNKKTSGLRHRNACCAGAFALACSVARSSYLKRGFG
jgi:hypothetical protein